LYKINTIFDIADGGDFRQYIKALYRYRAHTKFFLVFDLRPKM